MSTYCMFLIYLTYFFQATAMEGVESNLQTDYTLRVCTQLEHKLSFYKNRKFFIWIFAYGIGKLYEIKI